MDLCRFEENEWFFEVSEEVLSLIVGQGYITCITPPIQELLTRALYDSMTSIAADCELATIRLEFMGIINYITFIPLSNR